MSDKSANSELVSGVEKVFSVTVKNTKEKMKNMKHSSPVDVEFYFKNASITEDGKIFSRRKNSETSVCELKLATRILPEYDEGEIWVKEGYVCFGNKEISEERYFEIVSGDRKIPRKGDVLKSKKGLNIREGYKQKKSSGEWVRASKVGWLEKGSLIEVTEEPKEAEKDRYWVKFKR